MQRRVLGLQPRGAARSRRRVQLGLQFVVAQRAGQRPVHTGVAREHRDLADGGLAHAQCGGELPHAQAGVTGQQLKCLSDLAHEDPWCGHRLSRPKSRAAYARWVTQNTDPVSAIKMERCPPSAWNGVRDHCGMLSAIRAEGCPGWRGIRTGQYLSLFRSSVAASQRVFSAPRGDKEAVTRRSANEDV